MKTILALALAGLLGGGAYFYKTSKAETTMVEEAEEVENVKPVGPVFNADSAFAFTQAQCDFGYRDMTVAPPGLSAVSRLMAAK